MSANTALQRVETDTSVTAPPASSNALIQFDREQLDVLKSTVAAGTSDAEFALFVEVCKSTGLNPFQKQIYAIVRETWNPQSRQKEPKMTIQTGIDGYRLIAARTGQHAGTDDAVFGPTDDAGHPAWAQVTVYRFLPNGYKASFTATARWTEYRQSKRNGELTGMWSNMPFGQLAKCAESLALRKAFPAELSGVYTREEMAQATADAYPSVEDADAAELVAEAKPNPKERIRQLDFPGKALVEGPAGQSADASQENRPSKSPPEPATATLVDDSTAESAKVVQRHAPDPDALAELCAERIELVSDASPEDLNAWWEEARDNWPKALGDRLRKEIQDEAARRKG